ncbi:MAG TPA: hypothetical protein VK914_08970 [bacterium]|nr:hypothetical protein [bacterium]
MRPALKRAFSLLALALAAGLRGAEAPPAAAGMEPLIDNGRSFSTAERRLPLHCLDLPGLLGQDATQVAQQLDRAAAAGFNAVSFEAPLFGPQGLSPNLGIMDPTACKALTGALEACGLRRLYAFPVLYPPDGVDGLVGTATARAVFFSGRHAWGWQCWTLAQAAALKVGGAPMTRAPQVGGWILYRGAWPGGAPMDSGAAAPLSPTALALEQNRLRLWTAATVQFARKIGFQQELGLGLWARQDLAPAPAAAQDLDGSVAGAPPVEAPSETLFSAQDLDRQSRDSDALPPVAGAESNLADDTAPSIDDSALLPAAPQNPWELEGLDWKAVEAVFQGLPMASQLNFLEFTLDTEDWYGVGARLAQAADRAEVPVLWRQDWRSASSYERGRHLEAPLPLAGLAGPWPDDGWPSDGAIWPGQAEGPATAPFRVQSLGLKRKGDAVLLEAGLSRPAALTVSWGLKLPLDHSTLVPDGPGILRRAALKGIPGGGWFLLRLKAVSPRFGVCLLRTRWVRAPL